MGCTNSSDRDRTITDPVLSISSSVDANAIDIESKLRVIANCLKNDSLVKYELESHQMNDASWRKLAEQFETMTIRSNELINKANPFDKYLFILEKGVVTEVLLTTVKSKYTEYSVFGFQDFKTPGKRKISFFTATDCLIHSISFQQWSDTIDKLSERRSIGDFPLFFGLSSAELKVVSSHAFRRSYSGKEVIIKQGENAKYFYIIADGFALISFKENSPEARFSNLGPSFDSTSYAADRRDENTVVYERVGRDYYFGHQSIILGIPQVKTITADGHVIVFQIDKASFKNLMPSVYSIVEDKVRGVLRNKKPYHRPDSTIIINDRNF